MTGGNLIQDLAIRFGKLQSSEFGSRHPAKRLHRRRFGIKRLAAEEVQLDPIVRIVVGNNRPAIDDLHSQTGLLETLADCRLFGRLARLYLAAGELGQPSLRHSQGALSYEELTFVLDNGNGD